MAKIERRKVVSQFTKFAISYLLLLPVMVNADPRPVFPQRPLCGSQLALVNYACTNLPLPAGPSPPFPSNTILAGDEQPPSPSPSSSIGLVDDQQQGTPGAPEQHESHQHRHGHRHGQRHGTPAEENCCKWLTNVDDVCACDLLVRLPGFLAKLRHNYTVVVNTTCSVTFSCAGSLARP